MGGRLFGGTDHAERRITETSLAVGSSRFWIGWVTRHGDKCARSTATVVLETLREWGWGNDVTFCGPLPRVTHLGLQSAVTYEIDLPRVRQPVPNDRKIARVEVIRSKVSGEVAAYLAEFGRRARSYRKDCCSQPTAHRGRMCRKTPKRLPIDYWPRSG
jgi:hypothetical protein